jgi:hypothetical protein
VRKVEAYRETLTRARPDVLVMVGSDHFHQLWLDNMPQFLVGKAPLFHLGAHPFLTLTLWIAMFERDHPEPLGMQRDYAARLSHFSPPYPDIAT